MKRSIRIDRLSLRVSGLSVDQARAVAADIPRHLDASTARVGGDKTVRVKTGAGDSPASIARQIGEAISRSLKGGK